MFCISGPNLVILAWMGDELSSGQARDCYTHTHTHTHGHTDPQTQAMTIPEGQNWPRVKMILWVWGNKCSVCCHAQGALLTLKWLGHFFQNVILFSNIVQHQCNITLGNQNAQLRSERPILEYGTSNQGIKHGIATIGSHFSDHRSQETAWIQAYVIP